MQVPRIPGLGMRTIKTATAVAICLVLGVVFDRLNLFNDIYTYSAPFFACTAAVICMQDTVEASLKQGLYRLFGTGVGGLVGIVVLYLNTNDILRIPVAFIGVTTCIVICNVSRVKRASAISCVVFCILLLTASDRNPYIYAVIRTVETAIGILVTIGVNKVIPSPNHPEYGGDEKSA